MSNLSDIQHISDTFDTPAPTADAPAPVNVYPLLGLALILASAAITCGGAYFLLRG